MELENNLEGQRVSAGQQCVDSSLYLPCFCSKFQENSTSFYFGTKDSEERKISKT